MNWLNGFELLCYGIVILALASLIRQKDTRALFAFGTGALVGFTMELLAVNFAGQYHYNDAFWLVLGVRPRHFPVFGGLMWGVLITYATIIAQRFGFRRFMTALVAGFLIVTMDLFLDVVAIRLDGGFWTWEGQQLDLIVSGQAFMGVAWINFLGYMIMAPSVAWLTLRSWEKLKESDTRKQALDMLLNSVGGVALAGAGNLVILLLNNLTNSVSSVVLFALVWVATAVIIVQKAVRTRIKLAHIKDWDWPMLIFWTASYTYALSAIGYLGIQASHAWYFAFGILAMLITVLFCLAEPSGEPPKSMVGQKTRNTQ